ncbi:hypothetical protein HWV62_42974 [Athelia sp. TMB]|nr:hypothetical protein HWV62_42974 [Athelia sp. TMB]
MMMPNLPDVPTSPVQRILNTNVAPSSTQIAQIHQTIQRVDGLKAQLNTQLSELASATAAANQRREELVQFAQAHARLLVPERRLPLEILARIFLHCVRDATPRADAVRARGALCAVCKTWQDVATATHALWTSFALVLRDADSPRDIADMSATWLARAGALPISIEVRNRVGVQLGPWLQNIVTAHAANVQHVALTLRPAELEFFSESGPAAPCRLPVLQKLEVEFLVSDDPGRAITMFADAPQLRSVRLMNVNLSGIVLPWAQLAELRSRGLSLSGLLDMLVACPQLLQFDGHMRSGGTSADGVVCFTKLHTLSLNVDSGTAQILNYLALPSLRDLRIHCSGDWRFDFGARLVPLVHRSACALRTLKLSFAQDTLRAHDLVECLRLVPTLTGLVLHFGCYTECFTDGVLARLTHGGTQPVLLPNLEDIDVYLYRTPCTRPALLAMVRSRCTARTEEGALLPVARLRTLDLSALMFQVGDGPASELHAIASAGQLELTIRIFMPAGDT